MGEAKASVVHRFLQRGPRLERRHLLLRHHHLFTGLGIAAFLGSAGLHFKRAEADKGDFISSEEGFRDRGSQGGQGLIGVLLGEFGFLSDLGYQFLLVHIDPLSLQRLGGVHSAASQWSYYSERMRQMRYETVDFARIFGIFGFTKRFFSAIIIIVILVSQQTQYTEVK